MVRASGPTEYKDVARRSPRARHAGSPPIVIPTQPSVPSCSEPSRPSLPVAAKAASPDRSCARPATVHRVVGTRKRALRSNKETDDENGKDPCGTPLTKNTPYKVDDELHLRWHIVLQISHGFSFDSPSSKRVIKNSEETMVPTALNGRSQRENRARKRRSSE